MNAATVAQMKSKVPQYIMLSDRNLKATAIHAPDTEKIKMSKKGIRIMLLLRDK